MSAIVSPKPWPLGPATTSVGTDLLEEPPEALQARSAPSGSGPDLSDSQQPFVMRWLASLTILGVLAGAGVGVLCQALSAPAEVVRGIGFPGQLFIRALKCIAVPMIFNSMVVSASSMMGSTSSSLMSRMAVYFYLATTFVAAFAGIAWFNIFRFAFAAKHFEAIGINQVAARNASAPNSLLLDTVLDFGEDLVPENLFNTLVDMQLLGLISFAIFFGAMLPRSENAKLMIRFCSVIGDTLVAMMRVIILFTPVGVGSLVAGSLAQEAKILTLVGNLGLLLLVVLLGQLVHVFVFYGGLYWGCTKTMPFRHYAGLPNVWMTAFGTSSSAATLSTTINCCEDLGVSKAVAHFVLPIGCTINMDGSALERPLVVLWIAHMAGQSVSFGGQVVLALTASLLSIGGSPIPSAGVSTLVLMVEDAGIAMNPRVQTLVAYCLSVEWLLDSLRTAVNVTGDSIGAAIIDHHIKNQSKDNAEESSTVADIEGVA